MKRMIPLMILLLTSCAASERLPAIQIENPIPMMPPSIKTACRAIQELPEVVTMGILVEHYHALIENYTICRLYNQAKIDWANQHGL
ncbi:hypothetical protein D7B12_17760 [Salmonella enterica]|nr:hypothetical protein [Salmonella enterica]